MMIRKCLSSFFLLLAITGFAQKIQWASEVLEFSSEFIYDKYPSQYTAQQILGEPSIIGDGQSSPCVWSPAKQDEGIQYIKVGFAEKQEIKQVFINEDFNGGSISAVYIYTNKASGGKQVEVYRNNNPTRYAQPQGLRLLLSSTVVGDAIKVELNTAAVAGYNTIDAIGISDSDQPLSAEIKLLSQPINFPPEKLPAMVNAQAKQLNPVVAPDGRKFYYTVQPSDDAKQKIYEADMDFTGNVLRAAKLGEPLNNENFNNSLLSVTPDGQMVLVLNVYNQDGTGAVGISTSRKTLYGWSFPEKVNMDEFENLNDYGEYYLSPNGQIMLMTIQMKDTYGSKDLYVSFKKKDGSGWTKPKNLGPKLNTADSEVSPFMAADGKTLYFSSGGHPGFGSKDMFVTKRLDDTWTNWTKPVNMGPPINGPTFDAYYTVTASGDYAYYSKEQNGKSNIYRIKLTEDARPESVWMIRGTVRDKKTLLPLATEIVYENLTTGEIMGRAYSDPETGQYQIVLPKGLQYGYHAEKDGYYALSESIEIEEKAVYKELEQDLYMQPVAIDEPIRMNNVFFFRSQANLIPTSYPELRTVLKMLNDNPRMVIKIEGHTDSYGNKEANLDLSKRRAQAIKDYLVENGIVSDRISTEGYGGDIPIADNDDPIERPKNRRVEFRILKI